MTRNQLADVFLDWWNNFLSVERFAECYGFSLETARRVIRVGRKAHNRRAEILKRNS